MRRAACVLAIGRILALESHHPKIAKNTRSVVISCLRYRDASAAIEWRCDTFGLEKHLVVLNADETIAHAKPSFGAGMIKLGSVQKGETEFGRLIKQQGEIDGGQTQSPYLVVNDADAIHASANAAEAKIAIEIKDEDYGGRESSCLDLEGHLWNFGTYDLC